MKSADDICEDGRKVFLLKDRKNKKDAQVGDTITDGKGAYKFPAKKKNVAGDTFYSKTPKQKVGATTCGAAKSNKVKP